MIKGLGEEITFKKMFPKLLDVVKVKAFRVSFQKLHIENSLVARNRNCSVWVSSIVH